MKSPESTLALRYASSALCLHRLSAAVEARCVGLVQQTLFADMLIELARHAEHKAEARELRNAKPAVARAKHLLAERFDQQVTLDELASVSGVSRFHLVHAFTREVGLSPHAYQVCVRVERARPMLRGGFAPAVVAATLGFADQSHFTRHFRKIMQITPSKYARLIQ